MEFVDNSYLAHITLYLSGAQKPNHSLYVSCIRYFLSRTHSKHSRIFLMNITLHIILDRASPVFSQQPYTVLHRTGFWQAE